ncbi:hypothetical protein GCM10027425_23240 [Alteromonas gracilis]
MRPLLAGLLILALTGCGATTGGGSATSAEIVGSWRLVTVEGGTSALTADRPEVELEVGAEEIGLTAGCNSHGGRWRLEGEVLVVTSLAATEMACDRWLMDRDAALAELLTGRPSYDVEGEALELRGEGVVLRFGRAG